MNQARGTCVMIYLKRVSRILNQAQAKTDTSGTDHLGPVTAVLATADK